MKLNDLNSIPYQPILETEEEHEETQSGRRIFVEQADSHLIPFKQALLERDASWQEEAVFYGVWGRLNCQLEGQEEVHTSLLPRPKESLEMIQNLKPGDERPDRSTMLEILVQVFYGDREMTAHLLDAWDESLRLLEERNRQQEERDQSKETQ